MLDAEFNNVTQEAFIDSSGFLAFEAPKNDYYVLRLSYPIPYDYYNQQAYYEQAQIEVYYYYYNYVFFTVGIVILGLGLVVTISNVLKNRARNR